MERTRAAGPDHSATLVSKTDSKIADVLDGSRTERYRRRQVKTEDIAKFQTEPTTAPATPASHQVRLEVKA
jgi:hypothetical protein